MRSLPLWGAALLAASVLPVHAQRAAGVRTAAPVLAVPAATTSPASALPLAPALALPAPAAPLPAPEAATLSPAATAGAAAEAASHGGAGASAASLREHAPAAAETAALDNLSDAHGESARNFHRAAGLGELAAEAPAVYAGDRVFPLGSPERPLRVAIVGSGPSGFYAAEALLDQKRLSVQVDMFERLPTPYGLVRSGVAPDHPRPKAVARNFEAIAAKPGFRFFGNVALGRDVSADDLRRHYDQVVYAVGSPSDRALEIRGEDLQGSHSATAFVGWYNGHPDHRGHAFDLSVEEAVVVGAGNVALDVLRLLAQDPQRLAGTDIAGHALQALRKSALRRVTLLVRRGPAQAAFSPLEMKEIAELAYADVGVRDEEVRLDPARLAALDPRAKMSVEILSSLAGRAPAGRPREVRLRFLVSPVELLGADGKVAAVRIERNRLVDDGKGGLKAEGTGEFETLPAGLVIRAVGYKGVPLPGVPFDPRGARIPNDAGRVTDPATGARVPDAYVVGWAKRGPNGLIGANRADSAATVKAMLEDAAGREAAASAERAPAAIDALLRERGVEYVAFEDWKRLERLEAERGAALGKTAEKFTDPTEMLRALRQPR